MLKRIYIFLIIVIFFQITANCQSEQFRKKIVFGADFGGNSIIYHPKYPDYIKKRAHTFFIIPNIGLEWHRNIVSGLQFGYGGGKSDFGEVKEYYYLGFYTRYNFERFKLKDELEEIFNRTIKLELTPFLEYNHLFSNIGFDHDTQYSKDIFRYAIIAPILGVDMSLFTSKIKVNVGYRLPSIYIDNKENVILKMKIGANLGLKIYL